MRAIFTLFASFVVLTACSGNSSTSSGESEITEPVSTVIISDARVRPPLPGRNLAAAYFRLESTAGDRLVSVTSPISERVEIHNHIDDGGILRMRKVHDGVKIPIKGSVEFRPGGYHVMLFDAAITTDTQDVMLTFDFEKGADVSVIADIMDGSDEGRQSYGSGDNHGENHQSTYGSGH